MNLRSVLCAGRLSVICRWPMADDRPGALVASLAESDQILGILLIPLPWGDVEADLSMTHV